MEDINGEIIVVKKQVGKAPVAVRIKDDIKDMKQIVGGCIEIVPTRINNKTYLLVCNDEGMENGSAPNILLENKNVVCGDIFITAPHQEDFRSLDFEEIEQIKKWCNRARVKSVSHDLEL